MIVCGVNGLRMVFVTVLWHSCRYILKPSFMCRADKSFDPFAESTVDGIIAGAVTVKVCQEEIITEV